jgi:signal transduction histidine kinase
VSADSSGVGYAVGRTDAQTHFASFLALADADGRRREVYGFAADPAVLEEMLHHSWISGRLLPQAANDSLLYARVLDDADVLVFAAPVAYDTIYSAERRFAEPLAGLRILMAARPDAANALIIGGIPEPPRARLSALILITSILVVSALLLIRREADLVRLRSDFIAGVSHELRTPLAQIRMFAETLLLGRVRTEGERTRSLQIIDQEARRLAHLVENVLIFAKSERRKSRINPQLTDLPADVREAVQGFAVLSRSRDIEVRTELQPGVSGPVDRSALRQILLNLLDNAVKYGPLQQRITVGLALFESDARIWVDDEGPGVPESEREKVFGRFVRLGRDVESPVGGSGIGLAIVRELVMLHGGRVWIEDAPGERGARVVVEFPGAYVRPDAAAGGWAVA